MSVMDPYSPIFSVSIQILPVSPITLAHLVNLLSITQMRGIPIWRDLNGENKSLL